MRTETNAQLLAGFGALFFVSVLVLPLMILGCNYEKKTEEHEQTTKNPVDTIEIHRVTYEKVVLDGHEYWYARGYSAGGGLTHSASCHCHTNKVEVVK